MTQRRIYFLLTPLAILQVAAHLIFWNDVASALEWPAFATMAANSCLALFLLVT